MNSTAKWILGLIVLVVVVGGWYFLQGKTTPTETGPIKVGFIAPLTGDLGSFGESVRQTVMLAVQETNDAGGINGRQVEVIYEDGQCDKAAADAAQKLINVDGVNYILGGVCSGETLAAAPIAEKNHVILFSGISSSPDITGAGDYVFRSFASDATSGNKAAQAMKERGYKKVAVISVRNEYAQALRNVFETTYKGLGGDVVASEGYVTDNKDFRTLLAKIKVSGAEALYLIPGGPVDGQALLQQIKNAGITLPKYSNELITTPSILKTGLADNVVYTEVVFDQNAPAAKAFFDSYIAHYKMVDPTTPPVYLASAYDAAKILFETIGKCGDTADQVKACLYQVKDRVGAAGSLTMDSNGDAIKEYVLKTIKNGKSEAYTI